MADHELHTLRQQLSALGARSPTSDNAAEIQSELLSLRAIISSLQALIPMLALGPTRQRREAELRAATQRQTQLTAQPVPTGPVAQLQRGLHLAQAEAQIAVTEAFRAAVVARKAAL